MTERIGRERLLAMLLASTPDRMLDAITTLSPADTADLTDLRLGLVELAALVSPVVPPAGLRGRLLAARPRPRRPRRPVMVVLDMINDHLTPGRPLEVERARDIVPALHRRLAEARSVGIPVVYACDSHSSDDPDYGVWPIHALDGSAGAGIWPALAPEPGDLVVKKPTYSAFTRSELGTVLEGLGIQATAVDALQRGYVVSIPPDSQAGVSELAENFTMLSLSAMPPYDPLYLRATSGP
jgi:nicotinamidase/pyrazinamidase